MASENTGRTSSTLLLEELEALSQTLYQNHTSRRTNSLALPRDAVPPILINQGPEVPGTALAQEKLNPKPRQRRLSLSPWRSRPKAEEEKQQVKIPTPQELKLELQKLDSSSSSSSEKKGLWGWKPLRALSHITMQKTSCLFSVEVVTVQGLPASMNGLRLSVCVRKKETKDGAVHTMPSRVSQGAADFEETLFIRCHVYSTPSGGSGAAKFEPRPFLIYVFAVDAEELDFGRSSVDLSRLIQESINKSSEGARVRQWDTSFSLSGKAKGGEVVLKLGFQLMEKDGGIGIYSQAEGQKSKQGRNIGSASGRKQSKSSFSIPSPRVTSRAEVWTPSQRGTAPDFHGIDHLNLDEPAPVVPSVQRSEEPEEDKEDLDLPDFEVVEKGVEILQDKAEIKSEDNSSGKSEVVKEVVHDKAHQARLTELDDIAKQIKALESMMADESASRTDEETASQASQKLDADEEIVTMEFLQLLEEEKGGDEFTFDHFDKPPTKEEHHGEEDSSEAESNVLIPDLGKGLGPVVQTRNGGYLAATNPLNTEVGKKDTPKLAMQLSKPVVLTSNIPGFEFFQKMAVVGVESLSAELASLMPMDEIVGKTAEQVAFEGIASAIIQGRNKEGASSSAARTVAAVKTMATALSSGRKERVSTGIWNVSEEPLTIDEILAQAMQKIESMAVEALKIQAEIAEEDSPFDVSPIEGENPNHHPLSSAVPLEDWVNNSNSSEEKELLSTSITIAVVVQLRDPLRRYEAVGGPVIALIKAAVSDGEVEKDDDDKEKRYKVESMHVGGVRVRSRGKKMVWDSDKQRLTAMQWLVAYGLGKVGKKVKAAASKGPDLLWSISSRVMADMWLKPMRNPDVKFTK